MWANISQKPDCYLEMPVNHSVVVAVYVYHTSLEKGANSTLLQIRKMSSNLSAKCHKSFMFKKIIFNADLSL